MFRFATDVAIVGGGVAGTSAALTLRRYARCDCMILEASDYQAERPGETVSPALVPLLDYLGVPSFIESGHAVPMYGTEASWGSTSLASRDSLYSQTGHGWALDRRRFDLSQALAAERAGVRVLQCAKLVNVARDPNGAWRIGFRHRGVPCEVAARQLIDASGRRSILARKLGAKRTTSDRLLGLTLLGEIAASQTVAQTLMVEAAPDGWWYTAPLPNGRIVVTFLTDSDLARVAGETLLSSFSLRLRQCRHLQVRCGALSSASGILVHSAQSQFVTPCIGDNWIATGEAAASFDPISSLGIGHAIISGIQSARIAHERLEGKHVLRRAYEADVASHVTAYRIRRRLLYASERRWAEMPFWKRRSSPETPAM